LCSFFENVGTIIKNYKIKSILGKFEVTNPFGKHLDLTPNASTLLRFVEGFRIDIFTVSDIN